MNFNIFYLLFISLCAILPAKAAIAASNPGELAHTFSIVARDATTGEIGVAVQTHWFAVGTSVSWAKPGVGAIATQSFTNRSFGPRGLELLGQGLEAQKVLDTLLADDPGRDLRQLAIVDAQGRVAAWTGKGNIPEAGHSVGKHFSVQANMMLRDTVWQAMDNAFTAAKGELADRMLAALDAAQAEGGDIRGRQSASLLVVSGEKAAAWEGVKFNLRVDDHPEPIKELHRLLRVAKAYRLMAEADVAVRGGDLAAGFAKFSSAGNLAPEKTEIKFWHAVTLINTKKIDQALPLLTDVYRNDAKWQQLLQRVRDAGLLQVDSLGWIKLQKLK